MPDHLPHLPLPGPQRIPYRYPGTPRDERQLPERDPAVHAARLLADVASITRAIEELRAVERPPEAQGHLVKAVQSDRARVTAEELRGSRAVSVWPVGGWWRGRPDREDAAVAYSLIVTLDAGDADVDVYPAVLNELQIEPPIEVAIET